MSHNNEQENLKDTIVIDSSLSGDSSDVITITSSDLNNENSNNNHSYKISSQGKVIINDVLSNLKENHLKDGKWKEILAKELTKYGFEKIPDELDEIHLESILEFSVNKMIKNIQYGQIHPFSVEKADNGDLIIILLMYNGNMHPFDLESIPLKVKDANDKVVFADLANLNKTISPKKIGIYCLRINEENLKENNMDLTKWNITFEL